MRLEIEVVTPFQIAELERNRAWVADAVADGWSIEPTYSQEPVERAARLRRDGFSVQALMRDNDRPHGRTIETSIHVWGPDGLAVRPGLKYNFDQLRAGLRTCNSCRATDVPTRRYSFAGRCCEACLPAMRAKHEQGNWTA